VVQQLHLQHLLFPACISYLLYDKQHIQGKKMSISDTQIFVALILALVTGILALQLGAELYN
jgi:photosystem I reaction center subunit XII